MIKKTLKNDEINLGQFFRIIWTEKLKIISIIFISVVLASIYLSKQKSSFDLSLKVYPSTSNFFFKYRLLNNILTRENTSLQISRDIIYERFLDEFKDYEELITILENNDFVKSAVSRLSSLEADQVVADLSRSFTVIRPKNKNYHVIKGNWGDTKQSKKILEETLELVLLNVKKGYIKDLTDMAQIIELTNFNRMKELKLELLFYDEEQKERKQVRIKYLKEQAKIAKELNIKENRLDIMSLSNNNLGSSLGLVYSSEIPYYLHGYKTIYKEIELLNQRSETIKNERYFNLKSQMNAVKSDMSAEILLNNITILKNNDDYLKWVNYDFLFAGIKSNSVNSIKIYIQSIILGFIIALLYLVITNLSSAEPKKASKKR